MRRRGIGRDEEFKRKVSGGAPLAGGVVLGEERPAPPAVTTELITLQSNQLVIVRLTDDGNQVVGYELRFIDPFRHRVIVFPLSPEQMAGLHGDIGEVLEGDTEATTAEEDSGQMELEAEDV